MLAAEFDPIEFKAFRDTFISRWLTRTTINHYMFIVKSMFKLAAGDGLTPTSCFGGSAMSRISSENDPTRKKKIRLGGLMMQW